MTNATFVLNKSHNKRRLGGKNIDKSKMSYFFHSMAGSRYSRSSKHFCEIAYNGDLMQTYYLVSTMR